MFISLISNHTDAILVKVDIYKPTFIYCVHEATDMCIAVLCL